MMNADLPDCSRAMQIHHTSVDTTPTLTGTKTPNKSGRIKREFGLNMQYLGRQRTLAKASLRTSPCRRKTSVWAGLGLGCHSGQRTLYN